MLDLEKIGGDLKRSTEKIAEMERRLEAGTRAATAERRALDVRRPLASNYFILWNRNTNVGLTWYEMFSTTEDMLLNALTFTTQLTGGTTRFWLSARPIGEPISSSLAGLNNSDRVIHAGYTADKPALLDWGAAGLLIPARWIISHMMEAGGYAVTGRMDFAASSPATLYKHY